MNVDMEKYGLYIGLGVALAIYGVGYMFVVSPLYSGRKGIKRTMRQLQNRHGDVKNALAQKQFANQALIEYHKKQKQKLESDKQKALKFFASKDVFLEKWFPQIEKNRKDGSKIDLTEFRAIYDQEKKKLVKEYANKKKFKIGQATIDFGGGGPIKAVETVINLPESAEIVIPSVMYKAQKDFWLIKGILKTLEEGKLQHLTELTVGKEDSGSYRGYFTQRLVHVAGRMNIGDVPSLVQKVLNNKFFLTMVRVVRVQRISYTPPIIPILVKWDERPKDTRVKEAKDEYLRNSGSKQKSVPIDVVIDFLVLDYQKKKNPQG